MKSIKTIAFSKFIEMCFLALIIFIFDTNCFSQEIHTQKGKASFYADKFNGRLTANGDIFDNNKLTAAHREFTFGTRLKVTNIKNGKTVFVVVNDRGPYAHGRIIDLTKRAAKELDFIKDGITDVIIEKDVDIKADTHSDLVFSDTKIIEGEVKSIWGTTRNVTTFGIQVASYEFWDNAVEHAKMIEGKGVDLPLIQSYKEGNKVFYRVMAGDFTQRIEAEKYLKELKRKNIKGFIKTY